MKFIYYKRSEEKELGFLKDHETIVPLASFLESMGKVGIKDMNDFINQMSETDLDKLFEVIKEGEGKSEGVSLSSVKILAPIEHPKRHIFCLGKNYMDHAKETKGLPGGSDDLPKFPIYFAKIANPAIGHEDNIMAFPELTDKVDYEVELAVIIGKDGINISKENAENHIFGYTIVNDISARNIQRKHGQWFKGKSLETYCPMGPVIVHKSQIPFPVALDIQCLINGEMRQDSNTDQLIFDIPTVIEDLSKGMYLRKGDIIITGTPAGVGLGFKPFKFLKPGDEIECRIEGIGSLKNTFGLEEK
ncbi:fumarylacetoacetate hydrolase family protein [Fusibacter sp. JL216-2]|uniref:fumarylacetoacetate hydrolase family protein n=1 Tax=Fusibacter sp. JL216-2 TaxID=3071453 RepID=UPI003D3493B7